MLWRVLLVEDQEEPQDPVRAEVASLVQTLLPGCPKGSNKPIFRNTKDEPWKRMTGVVRFLGIKKKLGWDLDPVKNKYSSYTCRHTFAHRMLSGYWNGGRGCSIETLAELIGGHAEGGVLPLRQRMGPALPDPLWAAIGVATVRTRSRPALQSRLRVNRSSEAQGKVRCDHVQSTRQSSAPWFSVVLEANR